MAALVTSSAFINRTAVADPDEARIFAWPNYNDTAFYKLYAEKLFANNPLLPDIVLL